MLNGKLLMLRFGGQLLTLHMQDKKLLTVQVYDEAKTSLVGNIYLGKVLNIANGVDAAFVEISKGFTCFLPLSEVKNPIMPGRTYDGKLRAGDELLVQVAKDAIKTKQPVLTTKLSISGNFLAVSLGNNKLGISNKIDETKKQEIVQFLQDEGMIDSAKKCVFDCMAPMKYCSNEHFAPERRSMEQCLADDMGVIIRTNAGSLQDFAVLKEEWFHLSGIFKDICNNGVHRTCFSCLYQNEKPYLTDLKNYYREEFSEIVTDCPDIFKELQVYFNHDILRLYTDSYPLEKLYSIKTQLEDALQSRVWLKSGGYLIIEPTEALTVIDVNTGKYETKRNQEEAVYHINMEAADEIAHQLKLRNLSGIIIVDFINMNDESHKQALLKRLDFLLRQDRIPAKVVDMTPLGLVEITRKRINRPLKEVLNH